MQNRWYISDISMFPSRYVRNFSKCISDGSWFICLLSLQMHPSSIQLRTHCWWHCLSSSLGTPAGNFSASTVRCGQLQVTIRIPSDWSSRDSKGGFAPGVWPPRRLHTVAYSGNVPHVFKRTLEIAVRRSLKKKTTVDSWTLMDIWNHLDILDIFDNSATPLS
jgi:hypothetical protein